MDWQRRSRRHGRRPGPGDPPPQPPTALVHEAYLGLVRSDQTTWQNRAHLYVAAAEARQDGPARVGHGPRLALPGAGRQPKRQASKELVDRVRALRHDLKVLYISGYTDDVISRHGITQTEASFLKKPYSAEHLARKIRSLLEHVGPQR